MNKLLFFMTGIAGILGIFAALPVTTDTRCFGAFPDTVSCGSDRQCENVKSAAGCASHAGMKCVGDDLYWYDSCGNKETLAKDCGIDTWTDNYRCSGNWAQRELIKRGCSFNGCFSISGWQNQQNCADNNKKCGTGGCVKSCADQCARDGDKRCASDDDYQVCRFGRSGCLEWIAKRCSNGTICQDNGDCVNAVKPVTVDLYGPSSVICKQNMNLSWVATNATSCWASGAWSGNKASSGSESINISSDNRTFTITCTGAAGSASDSLTVKFSGTTAAEAGDDKDIYENDSVGLDGSASGSSNNIEYSWSCNGGSLSDQASQRPIYKAPQVSRNTWFVCTLKVQNDCGQSDVDTVNILVKDRDAEGFNVVLDASPNNGCAPLKNVDLTARIEGTDLGSNRDFTYYFYCDGDSLYDKTVNTSATTVTVKDICDYEKSGAYTARVKVVNEDTDKTTNYAAQVQAKACGEANKAENISLEKTVSNLSNGTSYADATTAIPGDIVSFKIIITAESGSANNIIVRDVLPEKIYNPRDLRVNGNAVSGDIQSGINIGGLNEDESAVITFSASLNGPSSFGFGQTTLINTASTDSDSMYGSDAAMIFVSKAFVESATTVSTGLTDNPLLDSFAIPLGIALLAVWAFRLRLVKFDEWLDSRRKHYDKFRSNKQLKETLSRLKAKNIIDRMG